MASWSGDRVAISDGTFAMMEETTARDRFLDELQRILVSSDLTGRANILKRKPELTDLYTDLGVQTLRKTRTSTETHKTIGGVEKP